MNMDLFHQCFAILLFLFLTKNCAATNEGNFQTRQQTAFANVVLNYLRVPWINVNSSWVQRVASTCRDDVVKLYKSASLGEMWALQMLDSSSKIPPGILTGNIRDLGMYQECVRVKGDENPAKINGRHCMVSISVPSKFLNNAEELIMIQKASIFNPTADIDLSLTTSVCLPSSCGVEDVVGFVNASIQHVPDLVAFEVNVAQVTCSETEAVDDLIFGRILVLSFFTVVATLLILCTVCDCIVRAKLKTSSKIINTAAKFSLYTNMIKLSSTKVSPDTMPSIHGIRFLSTILIMLGHRVALTLIKPVINLSGHYEHRQSVGAMIVIMAPYVVDTFFLLTGFLIAYLFLQSLQKGKKFNVFVLYLHRYLRLTPCLAVLLLINIFILPKLGSGPMWETVIGKATDVCRRNWWANLLYVQNFVNSTEMCMLHTWYLAVEMQLFWICPIILYPLHFRPKLGLTFLGLLSILALVAPPLQLVFNEWAALFNPNKKMLTSYIEFFNFYPITYNRVLPYLIGIYLGYDLVNKQRRFTKAQLLFNWILSGIFVGFSAYATYFVQPNAPVYNVIWEVMYVSVARLGWCIATAWVFYACTQGYGGLVTRFLSLPIFVPLSRMCYSIYLVHFVIQVATNASEQSADYITTFGVLYQIWGDLAVSICAAFVLTLCFESPVIVLEKMLLVKKSDSATDRFSAQNQRKLSSIIRDHKKQIRGQSSCDLIGDSTKSRPESWRTVSEQLDNRSDNSLTQTSEEWAKAWQVWKSDPLRREIQLENSVENGLFENRTPVLEKELLVFLAGVRRGLGEAQNSTESEVSGPTTEGDSSSSKDGDVANQSTISSSATRSSKMRRKFFGSDASSEEFANRQIGGFP